MCCGYHLNLVQNVLWNITLCSKLQRLNKSSVQKSQTLSPELYRPSFIYTDWDAFDFAPTFLFPRVPGMLSPWSLVVSLVIPRLCPASLGSRHGPGLVLSSGGRAAAGGSGDSESELSVISSNKTCMCMMYPHVSLLRETKDPKWNLRGWNRVSMK